MTAPTASAGARTPRPDSVRSDFFVFQLGRTDFAVSTSIAREVVEARPATPVPLAPADLLGALNLRGEVVPLVRLERFLGLPVETAERSRSIVVLSLRELRLAVPVDRVLDVRHIAPWEIRRAAEALPDLARGVAVSEKGRTVILDGERLLERVADEIARGLRAAGSPATSAGRPDQEE